MKGKVDLRSFDLLRDLDLALSRFANTASETMQTMERELRQAEEELEDRIRICQRDLNYWKQAYKSAHKEQDKRYAAHKLETSLETLRRTNYYLNFLSEKQQAYHSQAERLKELVTENTFKARHYLRKSLENLQSYAAVQFSGSNVHSTLSSGSGKSGSATSEEKFKFPIDQKASFSHNPLPEGYRWVSIDQIDLKEIPKDIKFEKTSSDEMKTGFSILQNKILPALKKDPSRDSEYFRKQDIKSALDYLNGCQRIYEAFFGHSHIRLERYGNDPLYSITNGRHRIAIARELGWDALPAKTVDTPKRR